MRRLVYDSGRFLFLLRRRVHPPLALFREESFDGGLFIRFDLRRRRFSDESGVGQHADRPRDLLVHLQVFGHKTCLFLDAVSQIVGVPAAPEEEASK